MGRHSTGAKTVGEALRIDLTYLIKSGYFKRGAEVRGSLQWSNQWNSNVASISLVVKYPNASQPTMMLVYKETNHSTGESTTRTERIELESRPSNLGKGEVFYFICPESGKRCRILYRCYGSNIWKSREAYQHRIYYTSQQSSKREYPNNRYWQLDKQINKLRGKRKPGTYKGKVTRRAIRFQRLEGLQQIADHERWAPEAFNLSLRRAIFKGLPEYEELRRRAK